MGSTAFSGWFQTGMVCWRGCLVGFRLVWCVGEGVWVVPDWYGVLERVSGWFQIGLVCWRGFWVVPDFSVSWQSHAWHVDLFYQQGTGGHFHCVFIKWTDPWHDLFTTGQFEIDPKDLTLGEQLGAGCFGVSGRHQLSFLYQVLALLSGVKVGLCSCWLNAAQFFGTTECRIPVLRVFVRQR